MRSKLLLGVLVGALMGAVAPPAAADCPPAGRTVARSDDARVWRVTPRSRVARYYGCARRVGRVFRLDPRGGQVTAPESTLKLAATMVAYQTLDFDLRPFRVLVRSLRTGKVIHSASTNSGRSAEGHTSPGVRVVLKPNGSVAWTASVDCVCEGVDPSEKGWEVHAIGRDDRRVMLDRGPAVDAGSLRLAGPNAITWKHRGESRTAPLR